MTKQITIVGGGISGLTVLHNLRKRYGSKAEIRLFEQNPAAGGTMQSRRFNEYLFETGAEGFLNSSPQTIKLIEEIGLREELIRAQQQAKTRYICVNNTLHPLPTDPLGMLKFRPLSLGQKLRILQELFVPPGSDPAETVYDFGVRRLGEGFAEMFLDPMVKGIYGGDAHALNLKAAFPKIFDIEHRYGSLFKGMFALMKERRLKGKMGQPAGELCSLRRGMGQLIEKLAERYKADIRLNETVHAVSLQKEGFAVETSLEKHFAEHVFLSVPAASAARMIGRWHGELAECLERIEYAPISVVGLVYKRINFPRIPDGLGYLIPSREQKETLGVLFSSNIFADRSRNEDILLRVMLQPKDGPKSEKALTAMAKEELQTVLKVEGEPLYTFLADWPKAIPQYTTEYAKTIERMEGLLRPLPGLHLSANYIGGISVNDCIKQSENSVEKMRN